MYFNIITRDQSLLQITIHDDFLKSETDITRPMFDGTGYLSFPISETKSIRHLTSFSLEIKTEATDGMVLWIGEVKIVK